jgi:transcriptional regulator GlxA family with amidase domain
MGIKTTWLRGHDHLGVRVLELIERRSPSQVTAAVINRLEPIPPRVRRAVTWCFEVAFDGVPTVEHLARDMAVHRRTLVNRFRAAGYPSPAAFITWSRLLLAARMLDDHRVSVSEVTRALHFASPSQYRGMLRRYADLTPSAMRRRGALASVSERFHRACTVPCSGMADVSRSDPSSSQWMTG